MFFLCSVSLRKIGEKLFLFYSNYYRSGVFISLFHQFASLVVLAPAVWACGVGGLPLRRYSLRVRAEYSRVPSFTFRDHMGSPQILICGESGGTSCFYDLAERYRLRNLVAEREAPPVTRPMRVFCARALRERGFFVCCAAHLHRVSFPFPIHA